MITRCAVSDLPIYPGERVRWWLVQEVNIPWAPWTTEVYGMWTIRSLPLKGVYKDYGLVTVDSRQEGLKETILSLLGEDLVTTEPSPHDASPPPQPGMGWEEFLKFLNDGRIRVSHQDERKDFQEQVPYHPTRRRVCDLLKNNPIYRVLDREEGGIEVSLDPDHWDPDDDAVLEDANEILSMEYAVLESAPTDYGVGLYSLRVYPKPGIEVPGGHYLRFYPPRYDKRCLVKPAMCRADVWEALSYDRPKSMEENIRHMITLARVDRDRAPGRIRRLALSYSKERENPGVIWFGHTPDIGSVSLVDHFVMEAIKKDYPSDSRVEEWCKFASILDWHVRIGRPFRPSGMTGCDPADQATYLNRLLPIMETIRDREDKW